MVLRDLLRQAWQIQYRHKSIFLARPDYSQGGAVQLDPAIVKDQIRSAMQDECIAKLCTPATLQFIENMETEGPTRKSILPLIGDGPQLAKLYCPFRIMPLPSNFAVSYLPTFS
jgi:hypothetical protein